MAILSDRQTARVSGLLLGGGLLAAGALFVALMFGARAVDDLARISEQEQIANGVAARVQELEAQVVPQVDWDDAVANLDRKFDPVWADANLGAFLTQTAHFNRVYVIGPDERILFNREGDHRGDPAAGLEARHHAGGLIGKVRAAEAVRGDFHLAQPSKTMISRPIQASGVVRLGGLPWLVTATLVQPDFGVSLPTRHAPVVLTMRALDDHYAQELSRRYMLKQARLTSGAAMAANTGAARVAFNDLEGRPVAMLQWAPRQPGAALLAEIRVPLAIALILLIGVIVVLHRVALKSIGEVLSKQDELVEAVRRAEASEKAKSEFLANMSHEIRTPLNGVTGVAELLARTRLNADQKDLVETIRASAAMLDRLLLDVLDMSKIEEGRLSINTDVLDIPTEIAAIAALWRPTAEARGLAFACDVDPGAAVSVSGDSVRLRQILSNLVSNALKFTQQGSVRLTVAREGHVFVFAVADTGIGFDEATKARLFDRFEQADGTITRRFGGSGLGLSISRTLASLMHGELDAQSEPGRGSVFTLKLPMPLARAETPGEAVAEQTLERPLRVLAADDHEINRKVVRLALEMLGASVTLACDGVEALELFATDSFDLVLMDMQMPNLDGLAATREIRRREAAERRPRTPIIMLSANAGADHVGAAREAGADGHVPKPLKPEVLLHEINNLSVFQAAA